MEYKVFTAHLDHDNLSLHVYDSKETHLHMLVESGSVDMTYLGSTFHLKQYDYTDNILEAPVEFHNPSSDFQGWLLGIDRSETPVYLQTMTAVPYHLIKILFHNPVLNLPPTEFKRLSHAFLKIEDCLATDHMFKYRMLTRIVQLFILELGQTLAVVQDSHAQEPISRKADLFAQFTEEVRNRCVSERKVSIYAQSLHVSPQYLNAVVKEISGESASQYIRKFVIARLVSALTDRSGTLKQTAAEFGFNDVPALYNYVKRYTGHSIAEIIDNNI